MRLGTFFGLTAPMLVLAYDNDIEQAVQTVGTLCKSVSNDIVQSLHEEFYFLQEAHKLLSVKFTPPSGSWFSEIEPDAMLSKGTVMGITCSQEVAFIDLRNELVLKLAQKIVDKEKSNKFVALSDGTASSLEQAVTELMNQDEFYVSEIQRVVNRLYKSLQSDSGQRMTDELISSYSHEASLPDNIVRNAASAQLTDTLTKIFWYFDNRRADIKRLFEITRASGSNDNTVFNLPFTAFMKRKPNYIEYVVIRWFKYLSGNRSASVLTNIVDDISNNLDSLISMINTLVLTDQTNSIAGGQFDTSVYEVSSEMANPKEYTEDELRLINDLYCRARSLTADKAAKLLGISSNEFSACAREACNVGVCGLNTHSFALFQDTLPNVIISDGYVCQKSDEYIREMHKSLDNVNALLENIKPLGALLEV